MYRGLEDEAFPSPTGPQRTLATAASAGLNDAAVAEYLLSKRFYLAALELHQELLEGNNGIHNVATLNQFFGSPDNYAGIVRQTLDKVKKNQVICKTVGGRVRKEVIGG